MNWTAGLTGIMQGINDGINTSEKIKNSWREDDKRRLDEADAAYEMTPVVLKDTEIYNRMSPVQRADVDQRAPGGIVTKRLFSTIAKELERDIQTKKAMDDYDYSITPIGDITKIPEWSVLDSNTQEWMQQQNVNRPYTRKTLDDARRDVRTKEEFAGLRVSMDKRQAEKDLKLALQLLAETPGPETMAAARRAQGALGQATEVFNATFINDYKKKNPKEAVELEGMSDAEASRYLTEKRLQTQKSTDAIKLQNIKNAGDLAVVGAGNKQKDPQLILSNIGKQAREIQEARKVIGQPMLDPTALTQHLLMLQSGSYLPGDADKVLKSMPTVPTPSALGLDGRSLPASPGAVTPKDLPTQAAEIVQKTLTEEKAATNAATAQGLEKKRKDSILAGFQVTQEDIDHDNAMGGAGLQYRDGKLYRIDFKTQKATLIPRKWAPIPRDIPAWGQ
jgi:hypothetical protein